jgi:hypothetical protein
VLRRDREDGVSADAYQPYSVEEGVNFGQPLPFQAATAVVDNLTASWLYVVNAGRFVPPWQYGVIIPFSGTAQAPALRWTTPAGLVAPTPGGGTATVTFTTAQLAATMGQSVVTPSQQQLLPIAAVTHLHGAGSTATVGATSFTVGVTAGAEAIVQYAVPQGVNSLIILWDSPGADYWAVTVTGATTGDIYGTARQGPFAVVISPAADPVVTITGIVSLTGAPGPVSIYVAASFGTQAVDISGQPIAITNDSASGVTIPLQVDIADQPIAVTTATASSQVAIFANSVNPGASAVIVAGVALQVVTIQGGYMGFSISAPGAFAGNLQTTSSGSVLVRARADTIVTTGIGELYIPPVIYPLSDLGGVPIAVGQGLEVTNDGASAAAVYFSGYLLFTQM